MPRLVFHPEGKPWGVAALMTKGDAKPKTRKVEKWFATRAKRNEWLKAQRETVMDAVYYNPTGGQEV